jgi:uncharacterized protein YggL (DUF469 family)
MSGACPRLGFEIRFALPADLAEEARLALWDEFAALVESRGLLCEGGGGAALWSHVVWREGGQAEDVDRAALAGWAAARAEIVRCDVGLLVDLDDAD